MVRRSAETAITLPPTKDWRALEQIRWSKLERDNEMFKKIQRHRYMNIIRSIQLEKNIKIKHYARMEEKLNVRIEKLEKVKTKYNIKKETGCEHTRKVKSCPLPPKPAAPDKEEDSLSPKSSLSDLSLDEEKEVKNAEEDKKVPSMTKLSCLVQNFLLPLCPIQDSLVSKTYQEKLTQSRGQQRALQRGGPPRVQSSSHSYEGRNNGTVLKQKSFYLTT